MMFDFSGGKLEFFKALYQEAEDAASAEMELMQQRIDQYLGSKEIDGSPVPARQVRNITYELIESQVTGYIPTPSVTPLVESRKNERNAKSIETLLRNKRNELPFERLNDLDERFSPIYGGSVWLVEWDESITTHNTTGDIRVTCLPPTAFVGQPNVYAIEDMEYCFICFETTKEEIVRKYGVTYKVAEEAESDDPEHDDGYTATLYVCYYKDRDGKICQYAWSGDAELVDIDDYYARRVKVCRKCGAKEGVCACEKPAYHLETLEYEEPSEPITLSDGLVIPTLSPVIENGQVQIETVREQIVDPTGQMVFDDSNGFVTPALNYMQMPKMQPTRLPYYAPSVFPIVIRKNTSREDCLFGQSDCDAIRPQQQGINKLESRIMEKLLKAGVTPVIPEDASVQMDNTVFGTVVQMRPGETRGQFGVIDTTPSISQDVMQSDRLYDQAKRIIGISDSFQGQYDPSASSGVAKQMQIQQAAGRLDSKRRMKNAAYADIDKVIFTLYLAYADEPRPSVRLLSDGRRENVMFNRYDFIAIDESTGEYYYDDRYMFSADASIDIESSRANLWQENLKSFQMGAYGNPADPNTLLTYWRNMEKAHYPYARENVDYFESLVKQQQAQQQVMQAMAPVQESNGGQMNGNEPNSIRAMV